MKGLWLVIVTLVTLVNAQNSLKYLVLGDWGGQSTDPYTTDIQIQVADQMGTYGQNFNPQFVVGVGDNFYDYGIPTDTTDPRFQSTFENVYTDPSLNVKWYQTMGNHDWEGNTTAQIQYTSVSSRWYLPAAWYNEVFTIPGSSSTVEMLFYDTQIFSDQINTPLANEQLAWIKQTLAASTADWLFMYGHYPVWGVSGTGPTPALVDYLLPLLNEYNVDAYICGHQHNMQHLIEANSTCQFFISGAGHECDHKQPYIDQNPANSLKYVWPTSKSVAEVTGAFMSVEITPTLMTVNYIDDQGNILYTTTLNQKRQ